MSKLELQTCILGSVYTNCYFLKNKETGEMIIIDPAACPEKIIQKVNEMQGRPVGILLTHGHFDHISAIDDLAKKYDFKLYVHEYDAEMLADPEKNLSSSLMIKPIVISHNFITYTDNEIIKSSGLEFEAIHTPGHTKGSTCLLLNAGEENILFTGDTLFAGGYGRTDFYGGDFSSLVNSMRRLYKLEGYYYCYPGHGDNTILGKKS